MVLYVPRVPIISGAFIVTNLDGSELLYAANGGPECVLIPPSAIISNPGSVRTLDTNVSPLTLLPTDRIVLVQNNSGAPITITVPFDLTLIRQIQVIDYLGNAGTSSITVAGSIGQPAVIDISWAWLSILTGNGSLIRNG